MGETEDTVKGLIKGPKETYSSPITFSVRAENQKNKNIGSSNEPNNEHEDILKLILTLSTNFIILSPEDTDDGIVDVLKSIGKYANVDRSYVFQFSEDDKWISNTHEWCEEDIAPQKQNLQGISSDSLYWFCSKIKNLEIVHIPDIDDIPLDAIELNPTSPSSSITY